MSSNYYEILGIQKDATEKEIKSAFRKKASELHPDKNKAANAAEEFKKVNEAYQVLSDSQKRQRYDQFGSQEFQGGNGGGGFDSNQFDFSDIFGGGGFDSVFGDDSPFSEIFGGGRSRSSAGSNKGQDIYVRIKITLDDVLHGPEKEIQFQRKEKCNTCKGQGGTKVETCKTCQGKGKVAQMTRSILGNVQVVRECPTCHGSGKEILEKCTICKGESVVDGTKNLKIRIPTGIETGMSLRFSGEGNAGRFNSPSGELYIEVEVQQDKRFLRQQDNLITKLEVPVYSLALGDDITISTLDGDARFKIKAGHQIGEKIKLGGYGLPNLRTKKRGDIIIDISVEIPKHLSKEQREYFEKLRSVSKK